MDMRQDALLAASKFVVTVNEVITSVKAARLVLLENFTS